MCRFANILYVAYVRMICSQIPVQILVLAQSCMTRASKESKSAYLLICYLLTLYDRNRYTQYRHWTFLTAAVVQLGLFVFLSLPMEFSSWATFLHPALSCDSTSIFLQLYLKPAIWIYDSRQISFPGVCLPPNSVHCSYCLTMLLLLILSMHPS